MEGSAGEGSPDTSESGHAGGKTADAIFSNAFCVIECTPGAGGCPSRISNCFENPFKGAGQYEASSYCAP